MQNFGEVLYNLPFDLKTKFRKLESNTKKHIMSKWSIVFNETCLKENLLPIYSNFRHHDPALARTKRTIDYKKYLIDRQINLHKKKISDLEKEIELLEREIEEYDFDQQLKRTTKDLLHNIIVNSETSEKTKIMKKLNNLYQGSILLKDEIKSFLNLSSYVLSPLEEDFLNLGLNFHIQRKYDRLDKQVQIELLYQNLLKMESCKKLTINPRLRELLSAETTKHRNKHHKSVISQELKEAAKKLKMNENLVIRRGDKTSIYVLIDKDDYLIKIKDIIRDPLKFKKISKNPTTSLKTKANKLIESLNSVQDDIKIPMITGEYKPGYLYGNIKTHKNGYPVRPIISQVLTPTYQLSKTLNSIITPYMPAQYSLKSTNDFLDLINSNPSNGTLASLDVVSLFTNVPIDTTIDIIMKHVYHHSTLNKPKIPPPILKEMLTLCTKEAPFTSPTGDLYLQIDGVTMGSPLGPTFANFYMGDLEENIFNNGILDKPKIYARYVDDIFLLVNNQQEIVNLQEAFQNNSVLQFTHEINIDNKLPFLDVLVDNSNNSFSTTVYRKATNQGQCLNGSSECVQRYKDSVIFSYLNRAYKVTRTWKDFDQEIQQVKQLLVNNNFSNTEIDSHINRFIDKKMQTSDTSSQQKPTELKIFYKNQMHQNYKLEERILKEIIYENTKCVNPQEKLTLIIYYKNLKTSNLIMKNNPSPKPPTLQQHNVIYMYSCNECITQHGQAGEYVGMTQTTLSRRLTMHLQTGSIKQHHLTNHETTLDRKSLVENTSILTRASNKQELAIKEAILILNRNPLINRQFNQFDNTLKLHHSKNNPQYQQLPLTQIATTDDGINTASPTEQQTLPASPHNERNHLTQDSITANHPISPSINQRINNLIQSNRQNQLAVLPMALSPRRLRPRIQPPISTEVERNMVD